MINLSPTTDNRTFVLTERVDVGPGYNLLALARTEEDLADLPKSGLINYLAHARKHGGKVQVRYTDPGIGRLNMAVVTTDKRGNETAHEMITQAQMWNYAKAACCTEYYRDVDICNCHPQLLVQMAEHHGLSCPQSRFRLSGTTLLSWGVGSYRRAPACACVRVLSQRAGLPARSPRQLTQWRRWLFQVMC